MLQKYRAECGRRRLSANPLHELVPSLEGPTIPGPNRARAVLEASAVKHLKLKLRWGLHEGGFRSCLVLATPAVGAHIRWLLRFGNVPFGPQRGPSSTCKGSLPGPPNFQRSAENATCLGIAYFAGRGTGLEAAGLNSGLGLETGRESVIVLEKTSSLNLSATCLGLSQRAYCWFVSFRMARSLSLSLSVRGSVLNFGKVPTLSCIFLVSPADSHRERERESEPASKSPTSSIRSVFCCFVACLVGPLAGSLVLTREASKVWSKVKVRFL